MNIVRPLFDAGRRPRRTAEQQARGVDAPRPDALRRPWRAAGSHPQGRNAVKDRRSRLTLASTVAFAFCLLSAPAFADTLTLTTLRKPHVEDPKDGVAAIMRKVWADEISDTPGSFSFTYTIAEIGGARFLVSSFRSGMSCRLNECDWQIQRLDAAYKVTAAGPRVTACGALDGVAVEADKLKICGKEAKLP